MRNTPPKLATILQTAYPALMLSYAAFTFPSIRADAERFAGPPYYLPFEVLNVVISVALFVTAFLLWKRFLTGWLLAILVDGFVALSLFSLVIVDRTSKWPMPGFALLIVTAIAATFSIVPVLLLTSSSLTTFGLRNKQCPVPPLH